MNDKKLDIISEKIDNLDIKLNDIDKTLAVNTQSLQEHMRRTQLAEQSIEKLADQIVPVQAHINKVNGMLMFIGLSASIAGTIAAIVKVIEFINL